MTLPSRSLRHLPAGMVLGIVLALAYLGGAFASLDRLIEDARTSLSARPASDELVLVAIDAESLDRLGPWPWPRRHFATVIDTLVETGAGRIALDVDFAERSSPEDDRVLARALAAAGPERIALPVFRQLHGGTGETMDRQPLPTFIEHVTLVHAGFTPAPDGLIRRYHSHRERLGRRLPGLAQWLAGEAEAASGIGVIDMTVDPATIPRLSFADVLAGTFDPALVGDRHVIVGATAAELGGLESVPVHQLLPSPVIHALVYETLRQPHPPRRLGGAPVAAVTIALSAALIVLLVPVPLPHALSASGGLIGGFLVTAGVFRLWLGISIDLAAVLTGLLLSLGAALLVKGRTRDILLREVTRNSFDAILIFDRNRRILFSNLTARRLFALRTGELEGKPVDDLLPQIGELPPAAGGVEGGPIRETVARRGDGSRFTAELSVSSLGVAEREVGVAVVRDITEREAQQVELVKLAMHDHLTGLANRTLLFGRMREAIAAAKRDGHSLGLLLLDLDRFKEVNDTLGHAVGDELLKQIGPQLQPCLRDQDTLARLGGDEFAILLARVRDVAAAREIADRIIEALRRPFVLGELQVEVAASIGIVLFPEHAGEPSELMQRADVAMYMAKRQQRGAVVYEAEHDQHSIRRLILHGELRRAIEQGALRLFYQPKIDVRSGRPLGAEALVRWPHPELGQIAAGEFIPFAEQTGLIRPLTDWALQEALMQHRQWCDEGYEIPIAVNLSVQSLQDPTLAERIEAILDGKHGALQLEITESSLMADPTAALRTLQDLSGLGCKIALDDFGTGYSCLAYLQQLPIDQLKIDRSFVMAMGADGGAIAIVRSVIGLAHSLGLSVVAEGVETEAQLDALRRLGCDEVQGFLFAAPLEPVEFRRWIAGPCDLTGPARPGREERVRARPGSLPPAPRPVATG